jgi:hypothetical protein
MGQVEAESKPMQSRGHGCKLSRKCQQAVAAVLAEPTLKRAARKVGVSEGALGQWLKIPAFARLLADARDQAFRHALTRMQTAATQAVEVLVAAMRRRRGDDRVKIKAAQALLTHCLRAAELLDLAERVAALEHELDQARKAKDDTHRAGGRVKT